MRRLVITPDHYSAADTGKALTMLHTGAERLHLRTIGASEAALRTLIEAFPAPYRSRLSIHEHFHLAQEYGTGIHLNSRHPAPPAGWCGVTSRSCHSIEELALFPDIDYMFLSPIFDSISKSGYRSAYTPEMLREGKERNLINPRVIALGGVTPNHETFLQQYGFGGYAMMGAAFSPVNRDKFRLQFITPDLPPQQLRDKTEEVLRGGCRWVQLRLKDASAATLIHSAELLRPLCRQHGATFIIDDHVELVRAVEADGVHLGKNDMPVAQARQLLGPGFIIGATANTAADIINAAAAGADYIGLGPLRFTTTKKNLAPTLGYDGYRRIIGQVRESGVDLPIVGIGGVVPSDLPRLLEAGVGGVAVCTAIDSFLNNTQQQ